MSVHLGSALRASKAAKCEKQRSRSARGYDVVLQATCRGACSRRKWRVVQTTQVAVRFARCAERACLAGERETVEGGLESRQGDLSSGRRTTCKVACTQVVACNVRGSWAWAVYTGRRVQCAGVLGPGRARCALGLLVDSSAACWRAQAGWRHKVVLGRHALVRARRFAEVLGRKSFPVLEKLRVANAELQKSSLPGAVECAVWAHNLKDGARGPGVPTRSGLRTA